MNYYLSGELEMAIRAASKKAREHSQGTYSPSHLLWGLLLEDVGLHPVISQMDKNVHKLRRWSEFKINHYKKSAVLNAEPEADEKVKVTLKKADDIRRNKYETTILPIHVLEAISHPHVAFSPEQLQYFPIAPSEFAQEFHALPIQEVSKENSTIAKSHKESEKGISNKVLEKYCKNLTERGKEGKIDPVIGRDDELKRLIEILGKRSSPNVLLVGEPGVGKTAIVGGLALKILENNVPIQLQGIDILELDVNGSLVAGAYKGEVEERLKNVLQGIKERGKAILFIDEIHALLDEKSSVGSGAVNLLKPELARGELTVIGATTQSEYQRFIESDEAFARRFSVVNVQEPDEDKAIKMVAGVMPRYEDHHQLKVEYEAIAEAVRLSKRYLGTKYLPVVAIELLDLCMSSVKLMNETSGKELVALEEQLNKIDVSEKQKDLFLEKHLKEFISIVQGKLSHVLISKLDKGLPPTDINNPLDTLKQLKQSLGQLQSLINRPQKRIDKRDIAAIVSYQSGIPLGKLQSEEKDKIQKLEDHLRKRVLGQNHALEIVADVLRRSRAEIKEPDKPVGVFFFVGPTGTGKTELAKTIADFLFNDEKSLLRFDMSEYKEEHAAALLYGAPPGYVGYKDGGLLVNQIRQKPYSVVLFDEIEKAHSNVYDIFLQIIDEGIVTDKQKKKGRFANAIVIFTSNLGSEWIEEQYKEGKGELPGKEALRTFFKNLKANKENVFRPEFLGRRMSLVPFAPISKEIAAEILNIHLDNFAKLLAQRQITLFFTDALKSSLVESGFSPVFGARPLKDTIEDRLGNLLANEIIGENINNGDNLELDVDGNDHILWKKRPSS